MLDNLIKKLRKIVFISLFKMWLINLLRMCLKIFIKKQSLLKLILIIELVVDKM